MDIILPTSNRRKLLQTLNSANSYLEWSRAAHELDKLEGNAKWKETIPDKNYDYELVQSRLEQFTKAREMNDLGASMFLLRTSKVYLII